jgi:NitT/TauT family transport system substrate-binding protein
MKKLIDTLLKRYMLIAVCFILFITSCQNSEPVKQTSIVALNGPSALSMLQMMDTTVANHWNIDTYKEPEQVRQLILQNKPDWAILPYNMAVMLFNKGCQYQLAAVPVWGSLYLAGIDSIASWKELKGKRIFIMARGMTPDLIMRELLKRNSLRPDTDVILDYSFPTHIDLALAAASGKAPIALLSEPMLSVSMEKNKLMKISLSMQDEWQKAVGNETPMAQTALLVKTEYAKQHQAEVKKFLSDYQASLAWVKQYPDSAAQRAVDLKLIATKTAANKAISRCHFEWMYADLGKAKLEQYTQLLLNQNPAVVGYKLPADSFYLTHP